MLRGYSVADLSICGQFEEEPHFKHTYYGLSGEPETVLRTLTDRLWEEYAYRRGHAYARCIKPAEVKWGGEHGIDQYWLDDDWREYRVSLDTDESHTPLDLDKTLGELGLTEGRIWVRFERAV